MNIVLVEPEIPPNTGNVARLCAATGATLHLVGPLGFRMDDKNLRRAGMDYWQQVTWTSWESFQEFEAHVVALPPGLTCPALYLVETGSPRMYTEPRYRWGDYLVFGRETKGLPGALLEGHRDNCISIPQFNPQARSLNLANCAAIVLYEALRQIKGF